MYEPLETTTGKPIPFRFEERAHFRLHDNFEGKKQKRDICSFFEEVHLFSLPFLLLEYQISLQQKAKPHRQIHTSVVTLCMHSEEIIECIQPEFALY